MGLRTVCMCKGPSNDGGTSRPLGKTGKIRDDTGVKELNIRERTPWTILPLFKNTDRSIRLGAAYVILISDSALQQLI